MLPDIQPGNTKILYFFNCLLDGMHTKHNDMPDIKQFKGHTGSAFHGILISTSRTKATVTTKGNKLKFSTMRTGIHGTAERRITTVYYFIDIFHLSISGMEGIFYFLIIIGKDSL